MIVLAMRVSSLQTTRVFRSNCLLDFSKGAKKLVSDMLFDAVDTMLTMQNGMVDLQATDLSEIPND